VAVLLVSAELEELINACDRVLVLRDGATVAELDGADIGQEALLHAMAEGSAAGGAREGGAADG
jgi:ABC-type sugar transport system ATPase subunit